MPSPLDVDVSLFYDGAWHAVESEVFEAEQIKVTRGQGDEGAALRPASVKLTFNNATDKWRPTSPVSPLYGKVGRNTPLMVEVDSTTRATVEATSWQPDQSIDANRATGRGRFWVDLEAYGLLGRIAQWSDNLRSAATRHLIITLLATLGDLWPLDDPSTAVQAASLTGGIPTVRTNVAFGDPDHPGGGGTSAKIGADANLFVRYANPSATAWTVGLFFRLNATPVGATGLPIIDVVTTSGYSWDLFVNENEFNLNIGSATTFDVDVSLTFANLSPTDWMYTAFGATESAGTVSWFWLMYNENGSAIYSQSGSFSGTLGRLLEGVVNDNDYVRDARYSTLFSLTTGDFPSAASLAVPFNGWPGERAGTRFLRLMAELDLNATLLGVEAETWPMGPQRPDTLLNLLQEIARTEDALIFDSRDAIALTMRTRRHRYNQSAGLALTFGVNVAVPFREVLDDLDTHNRVIVSQRDGGDYEASLTTGRMSVQAPPAGVGEYKQTVAVDIADETAAGPVLAGWWLSRGTLERSRYSSVTVDLLAHPELATACNALDIGDLITVAGYEADTIPLIVIGLVDTIGNNTRRITFTTVPAELFLPGVYDTARYDSASTTTGASYAAGVNTIVFSTADFGDLWATTGNGTPYDCVCAGERFTVTAMGAASGTGPYTQPATVSRAINGVAKTLPANEPIHVATPGRYAL